MKINVLILVATMIFSLTACGSNAKPSASGQDMAGSVLVNVALLVPVVMSFMLMLHNRRLQFLWHETSSMSLLS